MATSQVNGRLLEFKYGSCIAEVFIGEDIASIQSIDSKIEGQGHATQCIKNIEQFAKESKLKEIWFPTVLSHRLTYHLSKNGYEEKNVGKHPEMDEDVIAMVKKIE